MANIIHVQFINNLSEIPVLARILKEFGQENKLEKKLVFDLNLALEELLTNIINYGHLDEKEHKIELTLKLENGLVISELVDDGREFDPFIKPDPNLELDLMDRPIGGLGVFLVKQLMDSFKYIRKDNKNFIFLAKKIV